MTDDLAELAAMRARTKALLVMSVRNYGDLSGDEAERECIAFQRMGCQLFNIPPTMLKHIGEEEVVAAMRAEDRKAAGMRQAPRGRGRPPTPHKHLWMTYTIEAYIGTGLNREDAITRAADKWAIARSTIDTIYRDNKLPKSESEVIRHYLSDTLEEIDEAIRRFRENERGNIP